MKYRLEIQFEAVVDIKTAYAWYENQRTGLGDELISEIEDCYASICENPEQYGYAKGSPHFRRMFVDRFPYIIVFEVSEDAVIVNAVAHVKQNRNF